MSGWYNGGRPKWFEVVIVVCLALPLLFLFVAGCLAQAADACTPPERPALCWRLNLQTGEATRDDAACSWWGGYEFMLAQHRQLDPDAARADFWREQAAVMGLVA